MHIPGYIIAKFRLFFGIVWHGGLVYSKQFPSSVTETKLNAILFSSEVNSTRYSEIEEPIRLRKNTSPAIYTLIYDIPTLFKSTREVDLCGVRACIFGFPDYCSTVKPSSQMGTVRSFNPL